jgi:hypothetical protein
MDRRVWRARAQGGYTRVFEIVDGEAKSPEISMNKRAFGEQIARKLNEAYAAGVADAKADHEREAKLKIADLLKEMGHDKAADLVRGAPI